MTTKLPVFLFLFFIINLHAQVGIGTTEPKTTLDVVGNAADASSLDGITAPRMTGDQLAAKTYTAAQNGAMVYVTAAATSPAGQAADVSAEGLYVYSSAQSKWLALKAPLSGGGSGWALTGNSVSATDFLGTTNYQPLLFRVNSALVGRFHPLGGLALGINSQANDNSSIAIGNTANANASNQAIAIGSNSGASGFRSVAIGLNSSATQNSSLALGNGTTASGQNSTALGLNASATGQNATALGYQASAPNATTIILGNTTAASDFNGSKVGIGTNAPTAKLQVNGTFRYVDATPG